MNGFFKIVLWGCLWMASAAAAQDVLPESVWENRLSATEDTVVPIEDGSPVFLVGETVLPPTEKAPQNAFVPTPVDWEQKQQTLTMQTPFGETFSVPYIEHVPYFFVTIQLLSNGQALITENIRLITTPDGAHPAGFSANRHIPHIHQHPPFPFQIPVSSSIPGLYPWRNMV